VTTNTEIVAIAETLRLTRFVVARLESGRATTQVRQLIEALAALGLELTVVPKSRRLAVGDLGKPSEVESSMRIGSS
jgi:hypothetical protein